MNSIYILKHTKSIHLLLGFILLLNAIGCDKKEDTPILLSVTPENILFDSSSGSKSFQLKTEGEWNISGNPNWFSLSAASGSKDAIITVTAEANPDANDRSAQLTIAVSGASSQMITVSQKGRMGTDLTQTVVNEKAGGLKSTLSEQIWKTVTRLTVKGNLNESDFQTIKDAASQLKYLDISGTSLTKIYDYALSNRKQKNNYAVIHSSDTEGGKPIGPPADDNQGWEVAMPFLEEVVIPDGTDTIGICAFAGCAFLKKVSLPDGLKVIELDAFSGCKSLPEIHLPTTLEKIEARAFFGTDTLTAITLPASLAHLGNQCFARSGLTSIEIPATVKEMESSIFAGCQRLVTVKLSGDRETLPDGIFAECTQLSGSGIHLPASMRKIGHSAFYGCTALTDLSFLPSGVTEIGNGTFGECSGLTSAKGLPTGLEKIGSSAFMRCTALSTFQVPDKIKVLDLFAFYQCHKLTSVTLPQGLDSILQSAFEECTALKEIAFPDHLSFLDHYSFKDCSSLEKVTLSASLDYTVSSNHLIRPVFAGCNKLATIVFPTGMRKIPNLLFRGCQGLTKIIIPEHITEIGAGAFSNCTNLSEIILPDNLISYGGFIGCSSLKEIVLPPKITALSGFSDCTSLEKVTAKGKITHIDGSCFSGCVSLKSFEVPEEVTYLAERAFEGCSGLTRITLPAKLTIIHDFAFAHCTNITEMICYATTPPRIENQGYSFGSVTNSRCVLRVPAGSVEQYKNADVWKEMQDRIVSLNGENIKKRIKQISLFPSLTTEIPENFMTFIYAGNHISEVETSFPGKIFIGTNAQGEYIITMPGDYLNQAYTNGYIKNYYTLNSAGLAISSRMEYINISDQVPEITYTYRYDTNNHLIESVRYENGIVTKLCTATWSNGNLSTLTLTNKRENRAPEVYNHFTYTNQENLSGFVSFNLLPEVYLNDPFDFFAYTAGILGKGSHNYPTCGSFGSDPMFRVSYTFDSNGDPSRINFIDGIGTSEEDHFYATLLFE